MQIPLKYCFNQQRRIIRKSLKTTDKKVALITSRYWSVRVIENDYDLRVIETLTPPSVDARGTERPHFQPDQQKPLLICLEEFLTERKRSWDVKHTFINETKDYRPKIGLFIEIIGNKPSGSLNTEDIVKYKKTLLKIPSNKNKKPQYKNLSIRELLKKNINKDDLLSNTTISNHLTKVSTFLNWLNQNNYSSLNLSSPLKRVIKKEKPDSKYRSVFSDTDLNKLFNNEYYQLNTHKNKSQYWIPLLAMYTGARLNELCQLNKNDFYKIDNIWVMDINDRNGNKLKTVSSKRIIPLHSKLIEKYKFIDFINNCKTEKLFPELKKTNIGYGASFSKWFNRTYKKSVGIEVKGSERKDFHSFRHTFANKLKQMGVEEYKVSELLGHTNGNSITYNRYGKQSLLQEKMEVIKKITINI